MSSTEITLLKGWIHRTMVHTKRMRRRFCALLLRNGVPTLCSYKKVIYPNMYGEFTGDYEECEISHEWSLPEYRISARMMSRGGVFLWMLIPLNTGSYADVALDDNIWAKEVALMGGYTGQALINSGINKVLKGVDYQVIFGTRSRRTAQLWVNCMRMATLYGSMKFWPSDYNDIIFYPLRDLPFLRKFTECCFTDVADPETGHSPIDLMESLSLYNNNVIGTSHIGKPSRKLTMKSLTDTVSRRVKDNMYKIGHELRRGSTKPIRSPSRAESSLESPSRYIGTSTGSITCEAEVSNKLVVVVPWTLFGYKMDSSMPGSVDIDESLQHVTQQVARFFKNPTLKKITDFSTIPKSETEASGIGSFLSNAFVGDQPSFCFKIAFSIEGQYYSLLETEDGRQDIYATSVHSIWGVHNDKLVSRCDMEIKGDLLYMNGTVVTHVVLEIKIPRASIRVSLPLWFARSSTCRVEVFLKPIGGDKHIAAQLQIRGSEDRATHCLYLGSTYHQPLNEIPVANGEKPHFNMVRRNPRLDSNTSYIGDSNISGGRGIDLVHGDVDIVDNEDTQRMLSNILPDRSGAYTDNECIWERATVQDESTDPPSQLPANSQTKSLTRSDAPASDNDSWSSPPPTSRSHFPEKSVLTESTIYGENYYTVYNDNCTVPQESTWLDLELATDESSTYTNYTGYSFVCNMKSKVLQKIAISSNIHKSTTAKLLGALYFLFNPYPYHGYLREIHLCDTVGSGDDALVIEEDLLYSMKTIAVDIKVFTKKLKMFSENVYGVLSFRRKETYSSIYWMGLFYVLLLWSRSKSVIGVIMLLWVIYVVDLSLRDNPLYNKILSDWPILAVLTPNGDTPSNAKRRLSQRPKTDEEIRNIYLWSLGLRNIDLHRAMRDVYFHDVVYDESDEPMDPNCMYRLINIGVNSEDRTYRSGIEEVLVCCVFGIFGFIRLWWLTVYGGDYMVANGAYCDRNDVICDDLKDEDTEPSKGDSALSDKSKVIPMENMEYIVDALYFIISRWPAQSVIQTKYKPDKLDISNTLNLMLSHFANGRSIYFSESQTIRRVVKYIDNPQVQWDWGVFGPQYARLVVLLYILAKGLLYTLFVPIHVFIVHKTVSMATDNWQERKLKAWIAASVTHEVIQKRPWSLISQTSMNLMRHINDQNHI